MDEFRREALTKWPNPPTTPQDALDHVLKIYEDYPDGMKVLTGTTNIYPGVPWTGLTLGDLRSLRALLPDTKKTGCGCYPHGPDDPCTCNGCGVCVGKVVGCTCDINWGCTSSDPCIDRSEGM